MSDLLDNLEKISKPELAALISSFFHLDNDLVSCVVHEKPFAVLPEEIDKMRAAPPPPGYAAEDRTEKIRKMREVIVALITGYIYGKEAGRVQ